MKIVGVRELKQRTRALIAKANRGEKIVITIHGKPAAALVRLPRNGLEGFLLADHLGWLKLSETSLSFWDNAEDEAWNEA
jgi:prevent-host-death family protein